MTQITKWHLNFVEQSREVFEKLPLRETNRNEDDSLIALRMGMDGDCIEVWELGSRIANFVQQMTPRPMPRQVVREFGFDMEAQLNVNEHKGKWHREHHQFLSNELNRNLASLCVELQKADKDKHEITIRCANIANYAMMIADNEGEHL